MLKSVEDIKKFIQWCRDNKVKSFKTKEVEFELSELSFVPQLDESELTEKSVQAAEETLADTAKQELDQEDEDLLFWSTKV